MLMCGNGVMSFGPKLEPLRYLHRDLLALTYPQLQLQCPQHHSVTVTGAGIRHGIPCLLITSKAWAIGSSSRLHPIRPSGVEGNETATKPGALESGTRQSRILP